MGEVCEFSGDSPSSESARADGTAGEWVPARAFRAHLLELLAASDLTLEEMAELVRVPRRAIRRLAYGRRDGRPVRRISPDIARRLLRVRRADLSDIDARRVSSDLIISALVDLLGVDGRVDVVAARVGAEPAVVWDVLTGAPTCSLRLVVRVRAAAEDLMATQLTSGLLGATPATRAAARTTARAAA